MCYLQNPLQTRVDLDGAMDIAYVVCSGAATPTDQSCMDSQIVIVYSGQQRMCDSVFDTSDCRSTASMCNANPDFTIPSTFNFTESGPVSIVCHRGL